MTRRAHLCAAWLLAGAVTGLTAGLAAARPGGGHSFSSGSSYSSSSRSSYSSGSYRSGSSYGSYGGGSREPQWYDVIIVGAGLGFLGLACAGGVITATRDIVADTREARRLEAQFDGIPLDPSRRPPRTAWTERPRPPQRRRSFKIRERDPHFSAIVLEDLATRLYAAGYLRAAPGRDLDALAPYLAPDVRDALHAECERHGHADNVVIGSLELGRISADPQRTFIVINVRSNVTFTGLDREQTVYFHERWTLARQIGVRTRPPEAVMQLGCPSCGAPFRSRDHRRCEHCDNVVADGAFEWQVVVREVVARERMPPTVARTVVEVGTDDPTVVERELRPHLAELAATPGASLDDLQRRVTAIFSELNAAWDARDLPRLRPLMTDALYDSMRYWLDAHTARGLHNRVEKATMTRIEPAKVRRDHFFDAVTLRIFAHCLDYTTDSAGEVVSGSRRRPRAYSEYWTLIRGRHPGERRADEGCPNCGGPLRLSAAGNCDHCGTHLTLGEFDWVLSKIEQDETYRG